MQLPKVMFKVKPAAKSVQGPLGAVQPCGGVFFFLASFCSPQNWDPPGLGDREGLEVQVCAGWLWGKLRQLHPWVPWGQSLVGRAARRATKKLCFNQGKHLKGLQVPMGCPWWLCQVGKLKQAAAWLSLHPISLQGMAVATHC